jgi:type I restriction enzyme M protein
LSDFDLAPEQQPFWNTFKKLIQQHEPAVVFDDFLSAMMNYMTPSTQSGFSVDRFNRYSRKERLMIGELINHVIHTYHQQVKHDKDWYDFFGTFYLFLASKHKTKALGQYFTPEAVVDLMVRMNAGDQDMTGKGIRVNDPTCGSGRFLIAYHAKYPGNYVFGEDIDLMCCKMTCLNMMLHGCEGEVVHHNSLKPEEYNHGWIINRVLRVAHMPSIESIDKEQSFIWRHWQERKSKPIPLEIKPENRSSGTGNQLSIF